MEAFTLLPDPQTNGGLLISVKSSAVDELINVFKDNGLNDFAEPIGKMIQLNEKIIWVKASQ